MTNAVKNKDANSQSCCKQPTSAISHQWIPVSKK